MKTLRISIAEPIFANAKKTEPVIISIAEQLEKGSVGNATFKADGKLLAKALLNSLPGGTLDALLVELLKQKQSVLRVAYEAE